MTTPVCPSYAVHRFSAEVISHAVWLYFRFPLSLRMVEEMLAVRGIIVSHETVRNASSPPMTGSTICFTFAAATSPPVSIELQGGVRLRCGPTSVGVLPQLERRATVALGRLSDDNLTVPNAQ